MEIVTEPEMANASLPEKVASPMSVATQKSDSIIAAASPNSASIPVVIESRDDGDHDLVQELEATKEKLVCEERRSRDLEKRLELKGISIDCQLKEQESKLESSRQELEIATQRNEGMRGTLNKLRHANNALLQRTASLARRDQLQKASIRTSTEEISKLMGIIEGFQHRFESLATNIVAVQTANTSSEDSQDNDATESSPEPTESTPEPKIEESHDSEKADDDIESVTTTSNKTSGKEDESDLASFEIATFALKEKNWRETESALQQQIKSLEASKIEIKLKFIQTLTRHQSLWHSERGRLEAEISTLRRELASSTEESPMAIPTETPNERENNENLETAGTHESVSNDTNATSSSTGSFETTATNDISVD